MKNKFSISVLIFSFFVLTAASYPTTYMGNKGKYSKHAQTKNNVKQIHQHQTTQKLAKASPVLNKTKTRSTSTVTTQSTIDSIDSKVEKLHKKAKGLDKDVLKLSLKAHENAKDKHVTDKNVISIIDYSKPSTEKRFWVIDLKNEKVLFYDFVAHGKNSGAKLAKKFSNVPGSLASSIGVYLTSSSYNGQHGYSMRLDGLEKGFNDNARARAIVMHGANYVSDSLAKQIGRLGRSWGCPALPHKTNKQVIDTIKDGSLLFAYYPDKQWLNSSTFLS